MRKEEFDIQAALRGQFERAQITKLDLPYLLMTRGPEPNPCPIHGKDEGLVLHIDHEYWKTFKTYTIPECKCRIRQVTPREFERLKTEGCRDPDAPPILDDNGLMTGAKEKRKVPIKLTPYLEV